VTSDAYRKPSRDCGTQYEGKCIKKNGESRFFSGVLRSIEKIFSSSGESESEEERLVFGIKIFEIFTIVIIISTKLIYSIIISL